MFRNPILDLIGTRVLLPLVFAYLSALALAIAGVIRSLLTSSDSGSEEQS